MRQLKHLARAGGLILGLTMSNYMTSLSPSYVPPIPASPLIAGQQKDVRVGADGAIELWANAPPAPEVYGSFKHFGIFISPAQEFSPSFHTLSISYDATVPYGGSVRLDVRSSPDGTRWSEWEPGVENGASATFDIPGHFVQYRATLLGGEDAVPSVRAVRLTPLYEALPSALADERPPVAPTWKLHATREGLVGRHTANGHRITKRDHFVSLPSWRSLSPEGTNQYMVRVTYNGRSSVAPVYDVGPWNVHDNYWDEKRQIYADLPRGWPEDHAAYFDHYNGGRAEKGKVRFPTAIDIGDGVWWDDLGIRGDRAVVEVTFLWLGTDPLAGQPAAPPPAPPPAATPPPAPAAPPQPAAPAAPPAAAPPPAPAAAPPPGEIVVDERDPAFKGQAKVKWYNGPENCGNAGHSLWTFSTPNPSESENVGRWQPALPAEALYDVYVSVPACNNGYRDTMSARYLLKHRDGTQEITVNQVAEAGKWVLLGRFPFAAGDGGFVELRDISGDSMRTIWFDAVKWVKAP